MTATNPHVGATLVLQMALDRKRAGRKLARLRETHHLTQDELVDRTELSLRTIQRLEAGGNLPRWRSLDQLATVLGNGVYEIFREVGVEPDAPDATPDIMGRLNGGSVEERLVNIERKLDRLLKQSDQAGSQLEQIVDGIVGDDGERQTG